jgi:hypothetical protein
MQTEGLYIIGAFILILFLVLKFKIIRRILAIHLFILEAFLQYNF